MLNGNISFEDRGPIKGWKLRREKEKIITRVAFICVLTSYSKVTRATSRSPENTENHKTSNGFVHKNNK